MWRALRDAVWGAPDAEGMQEEPSEDEASCGSDEEDDPAGFTPLHIAALRDTILGGMHDPCEDEALCGSDEEGDPAGFTPLPLHLAALRDAVWGAAHEGMHGPGFGASRGSDDDDEGDPGFTPLHVAAEQDRPEMVNFLLLADDEIDAMSDQGWTPLYVGIYFGSVAASLALLAAGADVNVLCGEHKRSAVHMAAQEGRVDLLKAVIEHGADVNLVDANGNTPLHAATTANLTPESIDVLVEAGANIEAKDRGGSTPLLNAAIQYSIEGLRALLKHGADIDATNVQLRTGLVFAASKAGEQGAVEVVDFLLESGADETIVDDQGRVASDIVGWLTENYDDDDVQRDIKRVRQLLAKAPANRLWRRRGYLVLCRAHHDRVQLGRDSGSTHPGIAERAERSGGEEINEGGDWAGMVANVLGMKEEGLFRTIVEYL